MGSRASTPDISVNEPPSFMNEVPCCTTCNSRVKCFAHKHATATGTNLYLSHEFVHQARLKIGSGQLQKSKDNEKQVDATHRCGMRTFASGLNGTLPAQKHTLRCKR